MVKNHDCVQSAVITDLRIESAVVKQTTEKMANDIKEIKIELKNISSNLATELKDKVSRHELAQELKPIYERIDVNKSSITKFTNFLIQNAVAIILLIVIILMSAGLVPSDLLRMI